MGSQHTRIESTIPIQHKGLIYRKKIGKKKIKKKEKMRDKREKETSITFCTRRMRDACRNNAKQAARRHQEDGEAAKEERRG